MISADDALLIVDVQRDFLPGGALAVPHGDEVVPVLAACARAFARQGLTVVASRDWHPPDHCSFKQQGGPWPPHCIVETRGAEFHQDLNLPPGVIVVDKATTQEKDCYSAFDGTDLDAQLRDRGIRRIVVGGLATEYCVLNTAMDGLKNGFHVTLMTDAVGAIDPADGQRAIEALAQQGAVISQSAGVLHAKD